MEQMASGAGISNVDIENFFGNAKIDDSMKNFMNMILQIE